MEQTMSYSCPTVDLIRTRGHLIDTYQKKKTLKMTYLWYNDISIVMCLYMYEVCPRIMCYFALFNSYNCQTEWLCCCAVVLLCCCVVVFLCRCYVVMLCCYVVVSLCYYVVVSLCYYVVVLLCYCVVVLVDNFE